jgi:hypothetical protein
MSANQDTPTVAACAQCKPLLTHFGERIVVYRRMEAEDGLHGDGDTLMDGRRGDDSPVRRRILHAVDGGAGLRVVMTSIKTAMTRGGKFCLVGANRNISGLMKISGMVKFMTQVETIGECG